MSTARRALVSAAWAAVLAAWSPAHPQERPDRARAMAEARSFIDSGRPDLAVPIYRLLLATTPDDPRLLLNLTVALFKAADYRDAIAICQRMLQVDPHSVPASLFLGASHFQLGEPSGAVEPLQRVVARRPDERDAQLMLAESLALLKRHEEALPHFETAATLLAREPRVWYGLNRSYERVARAAADRLFDRFPGSSYAHASKARRYESQNDYRQAAYQFRAALESGDLDPHARRRVQGSLAAIYRHLAESRAPAERSEPSGTLPPPCDEADQACLFQAGRYTDSVLAGRANEDAGSLYWRWEAYQALAIEALARLEELPPSFQLFELRGRRDAFRRSHRSAAVHWRQALSLAPDNRVLKAGLASALFASHDYDAAVDVLDELLRADGASADVRLMRGSALLAMNRPDAAIPDLREAARLAPGMEAALAELGRAYLMANQPNQAIPPLRRILAADEDGSYHYRIAVAYNRTGKAGEAARMLDRYRRLNLAAEARRRELEERLILPRR